MAGRLILLLAFALAACGRQAPDGYSFDRKEFDRSRVEVSVFTYGGEAALRHAAAEMGVQPEGRKLMAFGFVEKGRAACTVHVVDPAVSYQPEWLGHELAHCLYGRWHQ